MIGSGEFPDTTLNNWRLATENQFSHPRQHNFPTRMMWRHGFR
jgi:hypothetical protein